MASSIQLRFLYPSFFRSFLAREKRISILSSKTRSFSIARTRSKISISPHFTSPSNSNIILLQSHPFNPFPIIPLSLGSIQRTRLLSTKTLQIQPDSKNQYSPANENSTSYPPPDGTVRQDGSAGVSEKNGTSTTKNPISDSITITERANELSGRSQKDGMPETHPSFSKLSSQGIRDAKEIGNVGIRQNHSLLNTTNSEPGLIGLGVADDSIPVGDISRPETSSDSSQSLADRIAALENGDGMRMTPNHTHYFDSWTLVHDLEDGGLAQAQSIAVMKVTRSLLSKHVEQVRKRLVSRSQVENDSYLFRAACSEIRTEIESSRRTEMEHQRAQRAQLHNEVDILSQRLTQDLATLRDEVKGLFDDRKMTVSMDQREMDSRIQELGHKITVTLNSDARSQVESLRWVLTRRAATALAVAAIMLLSSLRYYHSITQARERERKILESQAAIAAAAAAVASTAGGRSTRTDDPVRLDGDVFINTQV